MFGGVKNGSFQPFWADFSAPFGAGKTAWAKEIEPMAKAVTLAQSEAMGLMSRRTRAYMNWPTQFARCKSPADVLALQQAFWQQCVADYTTTAQAVGSYWSQNQVLTGLHETFEDQSMQSCPECGQERDIISFPETDEVPARRRAATGQRPDDGGLSRLDPRDDVELLFGRDW